MPFATGFAGVYQPNLGGSQIGDQMQSVDLGSIITKINGERWGRSGTFFSPSAYPTAATIPYLKAVGNQSTQATNFGGASYGDIATDGAGRWVIAYGDITNILVSTDNGVTFAAVAHNAGGAVTSVSWDSTNGVFIAAGNSAAAFFVSSAAAASVASPWTARTGSAITGGAANTAKVRSIGGVSVIVCGSGTTGNASRSTNGTSWSAINLAVGLSGAAGRTLLVPMGGSIWMAMSQGAGQNRSTDNGLTFSSVTLPSSNIISAAKNNTTLLLCDSSFNFYTSTTGATGSFTSLGKTLGAGYSLIPSAGGTIVSDGTNFYTPVLSANAGGLSDGRVAITSDGTNWSIKTVINRSWADSASIVNLVGIDTNSNFVMAPLLSSTGAAYGNFNSVTGVGIPYATSSTGGSLPSTVIYVRIA